MTWRWRGTPINKLPGLDLETAIKTTLAILAALFEERQRRVYSRRSKKDD